MKSLRVIPLLLTTAAFGYCGDTPLGVVLDPPAAQLVATGGAPAYECRIALSARLSGTGKGREVLWTGLYVVATDPDTRQQVATQDHRAAAMPGIFGAPRMARGETQDAEIVLRLEGPAWVNMHLSYQVLPSEGLVMSGAGATHTAVLCSSGMPV